MPTKAEAYRQLADRATKNLTAQAADWTRFLLVAGRCYKYRFLDQVMIYIQRPDATACADYDLWKQRMNRQVRYGSKGIALLRYRDGRIFLRYVFDVADTVRRENGRDPVPWQYRDEYGPAVASRLEDAFGVPGGAGLDKQLVTLAVRSADDHWHDFKDGIMRSVRGSSLEGMDGDNVGLRFRNAVTVSLSFLLLARCGFDLDGYFTPEDFSCIGEFDTGDTVLALGNAVSESANVILRQVERAVKERMRGPGNAAAGDGGPAAPAPGLPAAPTPGPGTGTALPGPPDAGEEATTAPVPGPGAAQPLPAAQEPPQEAPEQFAMPGYHGPQAALPGPPEAVREASAMPVPAAANFRVTEDLGNVGPKGRYVLNVEAIQTLRNVESEGRTATDVEQEMLARYTGWGAIPEAFDPDKPDWAGEYAELKALLTEDEYASARASTLNAHYARFVP